MSSYKRDTKELQEIRSDKFTKNNPNFYPFSNLTKTLNDFHSPRCLQCFPTQEKSCHDFQIVSRLVRTSQGTTSPYHGNLTSKFANRVTIPQDRVTIWHPANQLTASQNRVTMPNSCHDFSVLPDHKFEAKSQHN
ncbi:hypothetical protein MTR_7g099150 [Medicago truncatula]|uniref:Uncharacterized protein n=1 Tax=Medicago truncatula TaxID=3880 RepID=G7KYJ4_MEDTR|nr:hypothetical protein MTR_7g099150 [Medicago truncatula]